MSQTHPHFHIVGSKPATTDCNTEGCTKHAVVKLGPKTLCAGCAINDEEFKKQNLPKGGTNGEGKTNSKY